MTDEEKKEAFEHGFRVCLMSVENLFVMVEKAIGIPMTEVYTELMTGADERMEELKQAYVNEGFDVLRLRIATVNRMMTK